MHPKDADGMANSVDPNQTASSEAVWSWSALFAETYLSQYIEFLRYAFLENIYWQEIPVVLHTWNFIVQIYMLQFLISYLNYIYRPSKQYSTETRVV